MNHIFKPLTLAILMAILHLCFIQAQTFTEQTGISLAAVSGSCVAWGDYNNDGYLDILITGSNVSKIYKNNGDNTFTEQTSISLTGISNGSCAWGDYNNDGYLDILLSGSNIASRES